MSVAVVRATCPLPALIDAALAGCRAPARAGSACALGVLSAFALTGIAIANTYVVNTAGDPGLPGTLSLRDAVASANGSVGNTVQFDPGLAGSSVTLTQGYITINNAMTISGPGADKLTISGNDASRIFLVTAGGGKTVTFTGLTLSHGYTAGQLQGAGIAAFVGSNVVVDSCVLTANRSRSGAAIRTEGGGSLSINNSRITGNVSDFNGGGVFAKCYAPTSNCSAALTISRSTIDGNSAGQWGGGVYATYFHDVSITQSLISGNQAAPPAGQAGGGVFLYAVQNPHVTNSTISGNYSLGVAGGIYADFAYILFSTIAANSTHASDSNGIYARAGGEVLIQDSIVAGNFSTAGTSDLHGALTANFSLIKNPGTAIVGGAGSLIGVDPQLGPLADHGGPTKTMVPAPASPAVDAGEQVPPVNVDQRNLQRPLGANSDMGAVERQSIEDIVFRDGFNLL